MMKSPETSNGSNSTSGSASAVMEIARSSSASNTSTPNTSVTSMSDEQHTISKYSNFRGSGESIDALRAMKEVLEVILKNDIQGPQLFRLDSEFDLELGKGTQFKVTGASRQFRDNIRLMRKSEEVGVSQEEGSLWRMLDDLANSVVKRALWTPDLSNRQFLVEAHGKQLSQQDMTRELESQLRSAQKEIDKLCNKAYKRHPNIVRLKGWGLCLDTFEANTTLNTRIPLLILEKATCDLADFLASSNYNKTSFESLIKICSDIGTGLGALHAGNVTHGDMKPENILLFASGSLKPLETVWTAKLCDFGNAESRSSEVSAGIERFSAAGMYSSTSHAPEKAIYAGTPGWIPPEAFPDKGNFKSFDFESLKRCDVFVYGLIVWRIFQDESDRGVYDIITKRRRSNRVHLVDGERISEYLPPHDLAYQNAAKDIKRATRIERRRTDPSGILFTQRSRNIGMGRIPTSNDMWRILKVLRAALQPTPKYRDSRPWQFFDGTYYSTIQPFLESPILDEEASWTYKTLMHNLNKAVALGSKVSRQFSRSQKLASSMLQSPIVSTYGYLRLRMSSVVEKPQRHRAFETLFKAESSRLPLGWDIENLSELEHVGENCYPFPSIFSTMKDLYEQTAQEYNSKVTHQLYACARLRSRFKDCCWQSWSRYLRKFNAVALLLCCVNYTEDEYEVKRLRAIKLLVYHSNSYFPIIAWMCRGKIGQRELREIANSEQFSSRLWSWTHDREIPLELRNDLFKLFIESGCYVGPAFGRYLEGIVERSITIHTNYEYIINACAKVIQYSQIASGSEPGSNLMDVDIATRRFFLRGESPDQSEDNISKAVISNLHGYNTSTILHEAVIAFCYPAVEYLVQCSAIPFLVRNRDRKTPLELAYDIKGRNLVSWKLTQINAIIGILSKETRVQHSQHELPLGWEMVQVESGITVFRESTVNPTNPSLTFQTPKFSLLQETQIPLGSRKSDQGGLTYNFDLVRFMHRPKLDQLKHATKAFGDAWYKDESKNRIETLRIGMDDSHERISWVRFLVQLYKVMKVVLLRSYINALLIFLPISLLLTSEDQQNLTSLLISFLAAIPLIGGLESAVKDFHPISPNFMEQSVSSRSVSCIAEALIAIVALFGNDTSLIQQLLVGTIICNQLFIPGVCFFAGGIYNIRTGSSYHIEQRFNITAQDLASTLAVLASAFTIIMFLFTATQSSLSPEIEAGNMFLSRAISIIALILYIAWLYFRHHSHINLFETDYMDGYSDDNVRPQVEISPFANATVALISFFLLVIQARSIVASLQLLEPKIKSAFTIFFIPIFLRLTKHIEAFKSELQDQVDHTLDLTLGFTITVGYFLEPFLVLLSWYMNKDLSLRYDLYGTIAVSLSTLILKWITINGKSNWLKGTQMIAVYTLLALSGYLR